MDEGKLVRELVRELVICVFSFGLYPVVFDSSRPEW